MTRFKSAWLLLAVAMCLVPARAAETVVRATQVMGWGVFDSGGREIARLEDMVVDTAQNRLVSLLLSVGTREYRQVALPVPVQGARLHPQGGLVLEGASREKVVALPDTDRQALAAQPALRLASDLLRGDLQDRAGKRIGDIEDLVVRLDAPAPVHVAVKFEKSFHDAESLVAIPVTSIETAGAHFAAKFEAKDIRPSGAKPAAAAPPPPPPIEPEGRLTQILNAPVAGASGAVVGQVKDLAVDSSKREVTHVVVAGAAGPAAYPLGRFNVGLAGGKPVLTLKGDPADAVAVDASGMPPRRAPASRLLRSGISDSQGNGVGDVEDVVVNLKSGRLHFAVAEFNANWVAAGWLVAIPVRTLRKTGEGESLAMQFDLNELNRAYVFEKTKWPEVNDRAARELIDRYLAQLKR